jgi:hypothetical protein
MAKSNRIRVEGLNGVKRALSKLGNSSKQSRTLVNKALRPAAEIAKKALKAKYKYRIKTKTPGVRYDPKSKTKIQGKSTADSIGLKTAKRSRFPSIYVGAILKRVNTTWVKDKTSRNLAAMLIQGTKERFHKSGKSVGRVSPMHDFPKEVFDQKGSQISATAQRDVMKMLDKMIKQAGFK